MTPSRLCGGQVRRCRSCDKPVARGKTECPACGSGDIDENGTCRNRLDADTVRCRLHGGSAGQVVAARDRRAARRKAEGDLGRLLEEMGEADEAPHPLEGLPDAYGRAWLMVTALDLLVRDLQSPLGVNRHDELVTHPLVALHGEWLDRWARIQKIALDAGLDERRQALQEAEIERLFAAITAALAQIPAEWRETFRSSLADQLRRPAVAAR